jgi:hypothetical protein
LSLRAGRRQRAGGGVEEISAMHENSLADGGKPRTTVESHAPDWTDGAVSGDLISTV